MASPVCAHLAVLVVVSAGVWIVNLWKLLWAIYCSMQGQNVYVYRLYTLLPLCARMRIFCGVWKHHKVCNVFDHL